jgi:tRNA (uracil-5-)-methyltransferase TRM9
MENQENIWDNLAESWNNFRNKEMPIFNYFKKKYCNKKGKIVDLGCGNCRNLIPFKDFKCYGVDFSNEMLRYAKKLSNKHNFKVKLIKSDLDKLNFRNNSFDYVLMIASLHNLETKEKRVNALNEIYRILKNEGLALIIVWDKWQLKFLFKKKNLFIPWKKRDKTYYRYYYLFNYFELKNLLKKSNFKILESKRYKGNIMFIVKKSR